MTSTTQETTVSTQYDGYTISILEDGDYAASMGIDGIYTDASLRESAALYQEACETALLAAFPGATISYRTHDAAHGVRVLDPLGSDDDALTAEAGYILTDLFNANERPWYDCLVEAK